MKYLIVHEDGSLETVHTLTRDIMLAADEGYIDVVMYDGINFLQYADSEWCEI